MKTICLPSYKNGMFIPPPNKRDKSVCFTAYYYKMFISSKTHDLPFVIEYENADTLQL